MWAWHGMALHGVRTLFEIQEKLYANCKLCNTSGGIIKFLNKILCKLLNEGGWREGEMERGRGGNRTK